MPKFSAGQSGNPSGRKRGVQNKLTQEARRILESKVPEVLQATVQSAISGDSQAQRIILGLGLPKRIRAPIDLPRLDNTEAVLSSLNTLAEKLAQRAIEPDEARALAHVVETAGRCMDAEGRMLEFFNIVLETVATESPDTARRITARLAELQASSANSL